MTATKMTAEQSRACYLAAYEGFAKKWPNGFDVVIDLDRPDCRGAGRFGARAIMSGVHIDGDTIAFANCNESVFGDWDVSNTTAGEFVDGCMEAFGCIDIASDD